MKKSIVVILIVVVLMGIYVGYKEMILNKYKSEKINLDKTLIFKDTIEVTKSDAVAENIIKVGDISLNNIFTNYEVDETFDTIINSQKAKDNGIIGKKYTNNEEKVTIIEMPQLIELLSINVDDEGNNEIINFEKKADKSFVDFIKNNNIKDDIDLIKYVKDNYYCKSTIFTTKNQIKNNYIINVLGNSLKDGTSLITGDLTGYIVGGTRIFILHNNKNYYITLEGNEITTPDFINYLLSVVSFDN